MRNAMIRKVKELAQKNKDIVLISGDLGYGVLDDFRKELPKQYFNAGICEQNMASLAAGLAMEGKAVYTYSIGNFPTLRCIEQIRNDICYHNANVKILVVGGGFAYGSLGMSHHATEDIAMMRSLPNMMVFSPADPLEAEVIAEKTAKINAPCYIRMSKGGEPFLYSSAEKLLDYELGKAIQIKEGADGCVMATGAVAVEAVKASGLLAAEYMNISVYSFPCIKPIDRDTIIKCLESYSTIYTVEEHNVIGGFGSAVSEVAAEYGTKTKIIRIGLNDIYSSIVGSQTYLRHVYGMDAEAIVGRIKQNI